ncbi:hypothetical protein SLS60_009438 [Paraconiothyrium brasiliense]|uniref:Uncharacterized protein n=1 Tax=Paraconiothyrium brasiliense TaxID=300254 RepID=A0ABR3QUB9_9PLEO
MNKIRAAYPETLRKINDARLSFLHADGDKSIWDGSPEEREAFWEYFFGLRRVPMETNFYEAFNRPNVHLVDLLETPIDRIEEHWVQTSQENIPLDMLIYATGFSASKSPKILRVIDA